MKIFVNQKTKKEGKKLNFLLIDEDGSLMEGISFSDRLHQELEESKLLSIQKFVIQKPILVFSFNHGLLPNCDE